jgi:hypothetical protein
MGIGVPLPHLISGSFDLIHTLDDVRSMYNVHWIHIPLRPLPCSNTNVSHSGRLSTLVAVG